MTVRSAAIQDIVNAVQNGYLDAPLIARGFNGSGAPPSALAGGGTTVVQAAAGGELGFYGATPITVPAITGAKAGNTALTSVIAQLVALGLVTDSTT